MAMMERSKYVNGMEMYGVCVGLDVSGSLS